VTYQYGLKPLLASQPRIKLCDFYTSALPSAASLTFPLGHSSLISSWGMLDNDRIGDCEEAATLHMEMLFGAEAGKPITVTDQTAVQLYSAITGYKPGPELTNPDLAGENPTDQGTDMERGVDYWQNTGLINGSKIVGYAGLTVGDPNELAVALSRFEAVLIGINAADFIQDQFSAGGPWQPEPGRHQIVGGHAIPVVGATSPHLFEIVTWGGKIGMTDTFYQAYNTVSVVVLTEDMFNGGKDIDGIDFGALDVELPALNTGPLMAKAPKKKAKAAYDGGEGPYDYPLGDA
jgi:hypothetical protein